MKTEQEGFEPSVQIIVHSISNRALSASQTLLPLYYLNRIQIEGKISFYLRFIFFFRFDSLELKF